MPESTLRYDLHKLEQALPKVLVNQSPGPKPHSQGRQEQEKAEHPEASGPCRACGGKVRKNGTYKVLNWVLMLTLGWLGVQQVLIQRWRCKGCGQEQVSPTRSRQAQARQAWWQQGNRLIALSRFKLGLSVRLTQILVGFVYAKPVSVGHIERLSQGVGQRAEGALKKLPQCRQAVAQFLLFDETFPKMKERCYSLGVGICEHGLIRSVRCITRKAKDISAQLAQVVEGHFHPTYFLTDLDLFYNKSGCHLGCAQVFTLEKT